MKTKLTLLLLVVFSSNCSAPIASAQEKNLSRPTALSILRQNVNKLGWRPDSCGLKLSFWNNVQYPQGTSPKDSDPAMTQLAKWRWFYGELISAGILKDETLHTRPLTTYVPRMQLTQYQYSYTPIQQPDLVIKNGSIIFNLNGLSIDEVTGISQEGVRAKVLVKVSYVPTPGSAIIYKAIRNAYSRYGGTSSFMNPLTCGIPALDQASKGRSEIIPFQFTRFDDGWRVGQ